jgi:hypothetical protein
MTLKYPKIRYEYVSAIFDFKCIQLPASKIIEALLIAAKVILVN